MYGFRIGGLDLDLKRRTVTVSQDREVVPLDEFERHYILEVLKITNYQISGNRGAAALLGLPPSTLRGSIFLNLCIIHS